MKELKDYEYFKTDTGVLYKGDCREILPLIPKESVDFMVSSPPYFNLRQYAQWKTFDEHMDDVKIWFQHMSNALKQGRHICWNIQENTPEPGDEGRHYHPLMPKTIMTALDCGLEWEANIIWNKNNATQVMFGSYPYPPNIIYSKLTEPICVFRKKGKTDLSNKKKDIDKIDKNTWNEWKNNIWKFTPQTRSEHPAPYPIELPKRCMIMHSFIGDTVLGPFMGSGTTALACEQNKRKWIGIEIHEEYCEMIKKRVEEYTSQLKMF